MKFLCCLIVLLVRFEHITSTYASSFLFDQSKVYNEGDVFEIAVKGGVPGQTCTIVEDPDFLFTGATSLTNHGSTSTVTLTVSVTSDEETEPLEEKTLTYDCPSSYFKSATTTITIAGESAAGGDPHFNLFIEDENLGEQKEICFDVSSPFYKNLYIFKDITKNITVNGFLKDDYYMHNIVISLKNYQLKISLDGVYINNMKVQDWNSHDDKTMKKMGDFTIEIIPKNYHTLLIEIKKKYHFGSDVFTVKKSVKEVSGEFLDIAIQTHLKSDKADGLIGIIKQQRFKFFENVQYKDENVDGSTLINNRLVHSKKTRRNNRNCWLMDVNDILFPAKLDDFLN